MDLFPIQTTALHQHKFFYEEILADIDDAIIAVDINFKITNWNKAAERIYGIPAREALGARREDLVDYEYISCSYFQILIELKDTGKWRGVLKFTRRDGVDVYLHSSASFVKNDVGELAGFVAINRDITQQYFAQQSLEHFTDIMHSLKESFLVVNRDMKISFLSPKKKVQEFHDSDYQIGDDALKFIPEKDRQQVTANYEKAFKGEKISHEADSGGDAESRIYLQVTYLPIKNSYGFTTHVAIVIKDMTDEKRLEWILQKQKKMETELFHARSLFENFMQNSPLPAWVTDEDGVMQYMNPNYFTVTGFSRKDTGKTIYELFPKANAQQYAIHNADVLRTKTAITVIEQANDSEGNPITYLNTKFPLHFSGKQMVAGWGINISKQINAQDELRKANDFKLTVLSVISHDLRSPLSATGALTSMVADDSDLFTKENLLEFMNMIRSGNQKMLFLLDELLQWAQSKANRLNYAPQPVEIADIIYSSVDFLQQSLDEKNIKICYLLPTCARAYADADMLKTVVRNFLSNAIKFSPSGTTISVAVNCNDDTVNIGISDEGMGIDEKIKNLILEGNNNKSEYGTNGEKGIGLGLNICKDFIEANKGIMSIQNNSVKGCTFSFTAPKYKSDTIPSQPVVT